MHLQPGALEKIGDDGAGSLLFETQFRMRVQIMTKLRQEWQVLADAIQQSHGKLVLEYGKNPRHRWVCPNACCFVSVLAEKANEMNPPRIRGC
ncbi:hypothetical protein D3C86_1451020 [compost metagenome]